MKVRVYLREDSLLPHYHDPATHLTVTRRPQTVDRRQVGAGCECRPDVIIEPVAPARRRQPSAQPAEAGAAAPQPTEE